MPSSAKLLDLEELGIRGTRLSPGNCTKPIDTFKALCILKVTFLQSSNVNEVVAALDPKCPGNPKSLIFYVYVMKWMTSPKQLIPYSLLALANVEGHTSTILTVQLN